MQARKQDLNRLFLTKFERHKSGIYNYALKMTQSEEAAADITQDVFLKLYQGFSNGDQIENIRNWLFRITRNRCLNHIRDTKHTNILQNPIGSEINSGIAKNLNLLKLRRAIAKLKPDLREILILREYQGFSYREISEILDCSLSAVKSMLFRARQKLKHDLKI